MKPRFVKMVISREKLSAVLQQKGMSLKDLMFELRFSPYQERNFFNIWPHVCTMLGLKEILGIDPFTLLTEDPVG